MVFVFSIVIVFLFAKAEILIGINHLVKRLQIELIILKVYVHLPP